MSDNDVLEATAALKGILGIGINIGESTKDKKENSRVVISLKHDDRAAKLSEGNHSTYMYDQKLSGKKKKNKKKKKNAPGQNSQQPNNHKSSNQLQKQPQNQGEGRNSKPKKGQNKMPTNDVSKGRKKQNSNFAWSAFQSPPDPSSLPLPAFSSGSDLFSDSQSLEKSVQSSQEKNDDSHLVDLNTVAKSVSQLENEVIAAAEAAAASKMDNKINSPMFNTPTPATSQEAKEENNEKSGRTKISEDQNLIIQNSAEDDLGLKGDVKESKSQSGVNLAALTSSNNSERIEKNPPQSTYELMNAANVKYPHTFNPIHPQLQPNTQTPYSNAQHHHFSRHQQIVTIQVQIPPVLLPGRQMMVHTPAGYPIAVVVPENMRPGMIIPVNVPAPLNMHPHHPHHIGHSHHMQHQQQHNNQPSYPNQNSPHQRQNLHVTPYNSGQDPYYPQSLYHSKSPPQNNPTHSKK